MNKSDIFNEPPSPGTVRERIAANPTIFLILGLTVIALLARLVYLGDRIAHFDEGRVAYWALHFAESGQFHYRFQIHGPFFQHVSKWVFDVLGANDFTMRLPVAIIGGLLPATVLLYREHLRNAELLGAAFFLSLNPILVYYSRFYRSTVPAIAFAFVAFGLVVRAYDTRKVRYVYGGAAFVAFSFAAKENAAVYLLTWIGATALLVDLTLVRPRAQDTGISVLLSFWDRNIAGILRERSALRFLKYMVATVVIFLGVALFFYAPRAGNTGSVGLWKTLGDPAQFSTLIDVTLRGSQTQPGIIEGFDHWIGGGIGAPDRHPSIVDRYLSFLGVAFEAIGAFAVALVTLAVIGFFGDRYASGSERNVVMFASYWGFVSLLGFPLGSDIANAWITINGLVPLAIPAGVGVAMVYRWGKGAWEREDRISAAVAVLLFLLIALQVGQGLATGVYMNDTSSDNELVQYAQPGGDFRPELERIRTATTESGEPDVLVYDDPTASRPLVDGHQTAVRKPPCVGWHSALPLPWYFAIDEPTVECATNESELAAKLSDPPQVVIVHNRVAGQVTSRLPGYRIGTYQLRREGKWIRFFTDPDLDRGSASP